jgi:hypothetical protein
MYKTSICKQFVECECKIESQCVYTTEVCKHFVECQSEIESMYTTWISLKQGGVSHCGLAIYIKKSILRQKKNYENSNISPCKK